MSLDTSGRHSNQAAFPRERSYAAEEYGLRLRVTAALKLLFTKISSYYFCAYIDEVGAHNLVAFSTLLKLVSSYFSAPPVSTHSGLRLLLRSVS
jgi:hypothetical protein